MQNQVIAEIEIEDQKIEYYTSVLIRQAFNAHHEFAIRIKYDILEKVGSFSLTNAQKLIGKSAVIKLLQANSLEVAYELRGLICEISMEQSDNFTSDLVLKGFSPTILLENGPHLLSFYKKSLKDIAQKLTEPVSEANCKVNIAPQYKSPLTYICQYRESTFHFLNRLSADFGEWFYYDGKDLFFGKPSSSPNVDITYGEDVHNIQLSLRILPMNFSSYSYLSKDDKVVSVNAPANVDGLDQYASFALKESNKIFAAPVNIPVQQRIESKSDLEGFVKKRKAELAASLEVLTGSSDNPKLCIGAIANIKYCKWDNNSLVKEDYGKFLITSIEHHVTDNGKYYNSFEALPSGVEVVPVKNVINPIAEPQIATVKDNKDPDNLGRVRVQMLWQKDNEFTDWLRVMTPDGGGGKDGGKNRGLLLIPEPDDQVLVCFRYNDPNRPFVLGSLFHGKNGGGGGSGNNTKSLNSKSGHTITLDDGGGITIVDKTGGNIIVVDGTNAINVTSKQTIALSNGKSSITMEGDTITITAAHIDLEGTADTNFHSGAHGLTTNSGGDVGVNGTKTTLCGSAEATMTGAKSTVNGDTETTVNGGGKTTLSAGGKVAVQGAIVALN